MPLLRVLRASPSRAQRALAASLLVAMLGATSPSQAQNSLPNPPTMSDTLPQARLPGGQGNDDSDTQATPSTTNGTDNAAQQGQGQSQGTSSSVVRIPGGAARRLTDSPLAVPIIQLPRYVPGEFERYVADRVQMPEGQRIERFGRSMVTDFGTTASQDPMPAIPRDYVVRPGDEVSVSLAGTVDADLHLQVDRSGRITVPKAGAIDVAGLKNAELADAVQRKVGRFYRNVQVSASVSQVRAIRVFVSGFALRPGSLTVNGMASVLHVLMRAGGPSSAGSFRDVHLRRAGQDVGTFDLYDLLLNGNNAVDAFVQPDDVVYIGPVGPQVAVAGSVNQPAIFELKPGETVADALRMAGGLAAIADTRQIQLERLNAGGSTQAAEVKLADAARTPLQAGDILRATNLGELLTPMGRNSQRVHVEGEVARPGDYVLPAGSHLSDAIRAAGGLTPGAYLFGAEFTRVSVRQVQQKNYERALNDLETDLAKNQASKRISSNEEALSASASNSATSRLIEKLRQVKPTGRVVLQVSPDSSNLPDIALEDGDRLTVPARGSTIGVFGSVFSSGSYLYSDSQTTGDYLRLAGGPTSGADTGGMFVLRANGSVVSARQSASFWSRSGSFQDIPVLPGDTLFVPEQVNKSTFVQDAKDWTQILYQFGLGLAGLNAIGL